MERSCTMWPYMCSIQVWTGLWNVPVPYDPICVPGLNWTMERSCT
jgi:hypothetical protein